MTKNSFFFSMPSATKTPFEKGVLDSLKLLVIKKISLLSRFIVFIKLPVVFLSTLSGVTGFIVASHRVPFEVAWFALSLFLIASGSAALNQYQEHRIDRLMERTKTRPIPAGVLNPRAGLMISLFLIITGLSSMMILFGILPTALGVITIILYNGIYTYLKRVTAYAAVPGALIGALPPAIGWTAAGGIFTSSSLTVLMFFFYLWQVPHFWLLAGIHSKDYTNAGFPSLMNTFTYPQLARIIFTWIIACACAGMLLPLFGIFNHPASLLLLLIITTWLTLHALPLVTKQIQTETAFPRIFKNFNIFALLLMLILIIEKGFLIND